MPAPVFVTFTSGLVGGGSIRVSTQAPIVGLSAVTPGTQGSDGTLSAVTQITFSGGAPVLVSGSVTTTASALGVAASQPVFLPNVSVGDVAYGSVGTDAVSVAATQYFAEGFNPTDRLITNMAALNGSTAGTNKVIYFIAGSDGAILGTTALAGVTCSGTDAFQSIALATPFTLPAGKYWGGLQVNGTTTKHRRMAASTYLVATGSLAGGVFGTIAAIAPTTTFTADVGPVFYTT